MSACRIFWRLCLVGLLVVWAAPAGGAEMETDVVYGHKDGLALTFDVFYPEQEAHGAAVLFLVSGGWYSRWSPPEATRAFLRPYLDRGYTVMAIRHGSSPRYGIPDAVADVRRAVRFIRQEAERFNIDPTRMAALGMSAGGHLALMLATTGDDGQPSADDPLAAVSSRLKTVVALVPPTDLRHLVWDAPDCDPVYRQFPALDLSPERAAQNSPLLEVSPDDAPALVIMGGQDKLVPPEHGEWIQQAFQKHEVPSRLLILENSGHGLEGEDRERAMRTVLEWLDGHLQSS
jgi:acetyl esterase/lipase